MNIEIEIKKGLPTKQIQKFEDITVYNCALFTREITKSSNAYPYLTGKLSRSEIAYPILGSNKEYGLVAGVDYAVSVWGYTNVHWTNPNTQPQWYKTIFNKNSGVIVSSAVVYAVKEV